MGTLSYVPVPGVDPDYAPDAIDFENRLYVLSNTSLQRLSLAEDSWELNLPISYYPQTLFKHNDKLYLCNNSESEILFKLKDDYTAVEQITNYTHFWATGRPCSYNGELYVSLFDENDPGNTFFARYNEGLGDWETLFKLIDGAMYTCSVLANFNGYIYVNFEYYGLYKVDPTLLTSQYVGPSLYSLSGSYMVFNNSLYLTAYGNVYKISSDDTVTSFYDRYELYDKMVTFNNKLYIGYNEQYSNGALYVLNSDESGLENALPGTYLEGISAMAVVGNNFYIYPWYTNGYTFKYVTIVILNYGSDSVGGFAPLEVNFFVDVSSDFPIESVLWDFGDGNTSTELNPSHIYNDLGTYDVNVYVSNGVDSVSTYIGSIGVYDSTPLYIHNIQELQDVGDNSFSNCILANDIDASETITWNSGEGFLPLQQFHGNLDGAGYKITNLYINRPTEYNVGIFRDSVGSIFRDLTLENFYISANSYIGVICSNANYMQMYNCHGTGIINVPNGGYDIGGLIGYAYGSGVDGSLKIHECSVTVSMETYGGYDFGGIIGYTGGGVELKDCSANFTLINTSSDNMSTVGGIVGNINQCDIENCTATVNFTTYLSHGGGIAGRISDGSITNCSTSGDFQSTIEGSCYNTGGLVGYIGGSNGEMVSFCHSSVSMTYQSTGGQLGYCGLLIGYISISQGIVENCYTTGNISANLPNGYNSDLGLFIGNASSINRITNCYSTGDLTITSSFIGYCGGFLGNMVGDMIVSGCHSEGDVQVTAEFSSGYVGGFCGYSGFSVENSFAKGNVQCTAQISDPYYTGGFFGYYNGGYGDIRRCYALGDISGGFQVGGFSGSMTISGYNIYESFSTGSVTGYGQAVGGFSGYLSGNAVDCYSLGDATNNCITAQQSGIVGGFVGELDSINCNLLRCYSKGKVSLV